MAISNIMMDNRHLGVASKFYMNTNAQEKKKIKQKYTQGTPGHVLSAEYFYFDTAPNYDKELAIVCGGYEKCAPDYEIDRNDYPYYFMKCTTKGKGTLIINSNSYQLKAGVISGFGPGIPHHYIADPTDSMEHIFITFVGTSARELLESSLLANKGILEPTNPPETVETIEKIFNIGLEKKPYSQQICCSYLRILLLMQASNVSNYQKEFSISLSTYLKCKSYIDRNFSQLNSPQQVAQALGLNIRYIANLFKKYSDITPHQYIMRLKLNKAANLLLSTTFSIKEIADLVGFDDPYHFSRNFKKFHGISPLHYRQ